MSCTGTVGKVGRSALTRGWGSRSGSTGLSGSLGRKMDGSFGGAGDFMSPALKA